MTDKLYKHTNKWISSVLPELIIQSVCVWFPGDSVELVEYEGSAAGLIRSFTERFQDDAEQLESGLLELSKQDAPCWCWCVEGGRICFAISKKYQQKSDFSCFLSLQLYAIAEWFFLTSNKAIEPQQQNFSSTNWFLSTLVPCHVCFWWQLSCEWDDY